MSLPVDPFDWGPVITYIDLRLAGFTPGSGTSNGTEEVELLTSEIQPGLNLITADGKIADSANLAHFNHVVGIVMASVASGEIASVVVEGEVTNLGWSWFPNVKLFLNGTTLSTIPATSGFSQLVGVTRNSQTIFIRLQVPIKL